MAQYLKQDSELGYVEDVAEIERLKFNNLRHTILGCMLGDFDETGAYVVAPEIVEELIEMKKYIVDNYDNIEICRSELKLDKQISFMVTFEGNKATLSLLEKLSYEANFKINSGTYSNVNEYILDQVETSGEVNRNMVYQRWNISVYGGSVVDIFNCEESVLAKYLGVVNRFKYLMEANKQLLQKEEVLEEVEAGYANNILTILNSYPKLKEKVLTQVKETINEKKNALNVNKPNFSKTFNEVLENAIVSNINVLDEKEKDSFEKDKRNAVVDANIKKAEIVEVEHKKEDEQTPAVVKVTVPATVETKTIQELGEDFVEEHQKVIARYQPIAETDKQPKKQNVDSERNILIATLVGAGLGTAIGGAAGMVVGAVAGAVVAEAVEDVKEAVKDVKKAATLQNKAAAAKKPAVAKKNEKGGEKSTAKKAPAAKTAKTNSKSNDNDYSYDYDTENGAVDEQETDERLYVASDSLFQTLLRDLGVGQEKNEQDNNPKAPGQDGKVRIRKEGETTVEMYNSELQMSNANVNLNSAGVGKQGPQSSVDNQGIDNSLGY